MGKINYCIAAWGGARRAACPEYQLDRTWLIRKHLRQLRLLKHNLSQITIVNNLDNPQITGFVDFLRKLPNQIVLPNTKLVIVERPSNVGISYGAFNYCFDLYRDSFTHFLFTEDDYCPVQDNFDQILLDNYTKAGMLTPMARPPGPMIRHAAAGIAFSDTETLNTVYNRHGMLPSSNNDNGYGEASQLSFSAGFLRCGFDIYDTMEKYQFVMWTHLLTLVPHGDPSLPHLFAPVQLLKEIK